MGAPDWLMVESFRSIVAVKPDAQQLRMVGMAVEHIVLEKTYQEHAGRVRALAFSIVRSQAEAEEIMQDSFLQAWRKLDQYDERRGELSTWVLSMARARCLDQLRRARVRRRHAQSSPVVEFTQGTDQCAAANEVGEKLHRALRQLPQAQREVVELAFFCGITSQQIAKQTGTPLGTVKTRIRLGLQKLSHQLEEYR